MCLSKKALLAAYDSNYSVWVDTMRRCDSDKECTELHNSCHMLLLFTNE